MIGGAECAFHKLHVLKWEKRFFHPFIALGAGSGADAQPFFLYPSRRAGLQLFLHGIFSRPISCHHSMVFTRASSRPREGLQPTSFFRRRTSATKRGGSFSGDLSAPRRTISGFPRIRPMVAAICPMVTALPEATFTGPWTGLSRSAARAARCLGRVHKIAYLAAMGALGGPFLQQGGDDGRHEPGPVFMGAEKEKKPGPGQAQARSFGKRGSHLAQGFFAGPIDAVGIERGPSFHAKPAVPIVFKAGAHQNSPFPAQFLKCGQKLQAGRHPGEINEALPIFSGNRVPGQV